jgi:hypothetical protein
MRACTVAGRSTKITRNEMTTDGVDSMANVFLDE